VSATAAVAAGPLRLRTAAGRWTIAATVLGSGMAFLDGTVVNVALPAIAKDFNADLATLQWTVNAYTLTLAGLLILGGALGDRLGRRRIFVIGAIAFAAASVLCAAAPTAGTLIAARALQGIGGALLTPGSLAILEASFHEDDRGAAIGAWSGLAGIAGAVGPFIGGYLVEAWSWRLIFLINLPIAAAVVAVTVRHVPESMDQEARGQPLDVAGGVLGALGLAGLIFALTEGPARGWSEPLVLVPLIAGIALLLASLAVEHSRRNPLMPLALFKIPQFSAANAVTVAVYGALGAAIFLLPIQLQIVLGYSPVEAGAALVPLTLVLLLLSARVGRLAQRIGPRIPMTVGPLLAGAGVGLLSRVGAGSSYTRDVLPAVLVWALGMALTVAPLTATALGAAGPRYSGVAAAVNNDAARVAGLLAVAVIPPLAGLSTAGAIDPGSFSDGFRTALLISAVLCAAGGVLAFFTIRNPAPGEQAAGSYPHSCPLDAPPVAPREGVAAG
jgi:EmrB/QacA subfamily drug resistance transporter